MAKDSMKKAGSVGALPRLKFARPNSDATQYYNRCARTATKLKSLRVHAIGPCGAFTVTGQTAKALLALVGAGSKGVTALEVAGWAYRFAAYCHDLRHKHGLAIETVHESHDSGWHGRYVLLSPVQIVGCDE